MKKIIEKLEREILETFGTRFLTFEEVDASIEKLAEQAKDYQPDCIVGILRHGAYVGRKLHNLLGGDYQELHISRPCTQIGGMFLKDLVLIGKLKCFSDPAKIEVRGEFQDKNYKRILLADEDCGTGTTLNLGKKHIQSKNPHAEIKEAVLHICKEGYTPDYFIERAVPLNRFIGRSTRFPWAVYSPYAEMYQKKLEALAI